MKTIRILVGTFLVLLLVACGAGSGGQDQPVDEDPEIGTLASPTRLRVTSEADHVILSWQDNVDGIRDYAFEVERKEEDGPFELIATLPGDEITYQDSTVTDGTFYTYRVRVITDTLVSGYSGVASFKSQRVEADDAEVRAVELGEYSTVIPPGFLKADSSVIISTSKEPDGVYEGDIIGSTLRVVIPKDDIDFDAEYPLSIVIPPDEDFVAPEDEITMSILRYKTAQGEYEEMLWRYSSSASEFPVEIPTALLQAINDETGLSDPVILEVTPLELIFQDVEPEANARVTREELETFGHINLRRIPLLGISWTEGLFRFDSTSEVLPWDDIEGECGNDDASLHRLHNLFDAKPVTGDESALTSGVGKKPLVLVHGWQGTRLSIGNLFAGQQTLAPHLCGWREPLKELLSDPDIRNRFTLYTFSYDSFARVQTNADELRGVLGDAFQDPAFLIGHSMGGLLGHNAILDDSSAQRIAHLFTLGSPLRGSSAIECTATLLTNSCQRVETVLNPRLLPNAVLRGWFGVTLELPGTKDLSFEIAYGRHFRRVFPNVDNPYLTALNSRPIDNRRYTAFVSNMLFAEPDGSCDQEVDLHSEKPFDSNLSHVARDMCRQQGRWNDGIVSVRSATLYSQDYLEPNSSELLYSDLGSLSENSELSDIVYAPCMDHFQIQANMADMDLLEVPTHTDCSVSQGTQDPATIYGQIKQRLLNMVESPTVDAPTISSFQANPSSIAEGRSSTLAWELAGGEPESVTITPGVGDVTGESSVTVTPSSTTTYTLTAENAEGSATATVEVDVVSGEIETNIMFASGSVDASSADLSTMRSDGTGVRSLLETPGQLVQAHWNRSRTAMVITDRHSRSDHEQRLVRFDANLNVISNEHMLSVPQSHSYVYGWHVDEDSFLYREQVATCRALVWRRYFDGSEEVFLDPSVVGDGVVDTIDFHPNGREVIWTSQIGCWSPTLAIYRADVVDGNIDVDSIEVLLDDGQYVQPARYSPDGSLIAFRRSDASRGYDGPENLYVMNADGTNIRALTSNTSSSERLRNELAWSPDGAQLAFSQSSNWLSERTIDIFLVDIATSNISQLTFSEGQEMVMDW